MKIPKIIHIALILILFGGLVYLTSQIDWLKIFSESFELESLKSFFVTLFVMLVLIFQFYQNYFKNKDK